MAGNTLKQPNRDIFSQYRRSVTPYHIVLTAIHLSIKYIDLDKKREYDETNKGTYGREEDPHESGKIKKEKKGAAAYE